MSDRKILAINPEMFAITKNKNTRKRKAQSNTNKIQVRSSKTPKKTETMKKKSILRMIREQQSARHKNQSDIVASVNTTHSNDTSSEFNSAQQFFTNLEKKTQSGPVNLNHTLKRKPSFENTSTQSSSMYPNILNQVQPEHLEESIHINTTIPPSPAYGCLKNGSLPTYRNYLNQTRKHVSPPIITTHNNDALVPNHSDNLTHNTEDIETRIMQRTANIDDRIKMHSEMKQVREKINQLHQVPVRRRKRKKTIRRTYKVGRSSVAPHVSVLVSNKTLRNNILSRKQMLNQVSISDIKKYLIKQGLIKVGSICPNDVLRKMHETAIMVCGEIQNHNQDTLLYNFMNSKED